MSSPALTDQKSYDFLMACIDEKQRAYVVARSKGATPLQAAASAGYPDALAAADEQELNNNVRTAIEYAIRLQARATQLTRDDVIAGMQDALRAATTAGEMVMAWKEIGRLIDAYAPQKIEVTHKKLTDEELSTMSDDQLAELAAIDAEYVVLDDNPQGALPQ